jgi:hypothetical protein
LIQDTQLNARNRYELLEWILYNRLMDISFLAQGGFSKINKARWLDGWIKYWDYEKQNWERDVNVHDCENSINDSLKSMEIMVIT